MVWTNTSPLVKTYTLEEFWELPDPPDHSKLELIAGVLYMTPPPGYKHDNAVSKLIRKITEHLINSGVDGALHVPRAAIWSSQNTYLEPDLFYVSAQTEAQLEPEHRTTADLVIEVISPASAVYDRNMKADTYAALGVKELWLVDENGRETEVRELEGQEYGVGKRFSRGDVIDSAVLPGLDLKVSEIFKR